MNKMAEIPQTDITELVVETVDKIGESAARALESMADAFVRKSNADTERIADKLRQLAMAVREQGKSASEHMRAHCERSNDVGATVKELSARIAPKPKPVVNGRDDGAPIPRFLTVPPEIEEMAPDETARGG